MKPQSCKQKGRKFQQEIAQSIKDTFPVLRDNDVKSTSMGCGGEDIIMSPLTESMFPYSVECKNVEKLNVYKALEQAVANAPRGKESVLAMRRNRTKPYAVIPWEHFMELTKRSHQWRAQPEEGTQQTKRERDDDDECLRCKQFARLKTHISEMNSIVDQMK